jgi:hypothetical protein
MRYKAIWQGLVIFSLTFGFGVGFCEILSGELRTQTIRLEKSEAKKHIFSVEQKEVKDRKIVMPKCKKYRDGVNSAEKLAQKIRERVELELLIKNTASKKTKIYLQQLGRLDKQIKLLKSVNKEKKYSAKESNSIHNLLFIANCIEY